MEMFESALLAVLPLQGMVVFPGAITPLFVNRPQSAAALAASLKADKRVFLVCQKDFETLEPGLKDLHDVGTAAEIIQVMALPDGSSKILVEGLYAARAIEYMPIEGRMQALVVRAETGKLEEKVERAYRRTLLGLFDKYAKLSGKVPEELHQSIRHLDSTLALVHAVANYSAFDYRSKQQILEAATLEEKLMVLNASLEKEVQALALEGEIASKVMNQVGNSQRELLLQEQLKAIERELGMGPQDNAEHAELLALIEASGMSDEARAKAMKELGRLGRMAPLAPEATVSRSYIEWLAEIPWNERTPDRISLADAKRILEEDHFGLEKVKERIIEYLAVAKLSGAARGPILCFVGPPGVGKTSLARSIARCIGRKFVRISLGGVRDEAEIRGHRRTYVGAMPGKIVQSMKKAGTANPLFLLDEIDKMSSDFRGDPASAMLEVLDPEQNRTFNDHYLEVDYDLSSTMFITTANTTAGIPLPLLDRMEVIRISGYTDLEKVQIARRHLVAKSVAANGLKKSLVKIDKGALDLLIHGYTREAGVRDLERKLDTLCRKLAMKLVAQAEAKPRSRPSLPKVDAAAVRELLGPEPHRESELDQRPEVGNCIGLAWTEIGGEVLQVEARTMAGKGNLILTGKLGDVMKESATTALSFIRSQAAALGIDPLFHQNADIHIHLPEGAIPKDGPSAGVTMATSLASALSQRPVRQDLAMTGEITLRGKVLKIGGLKEKTLAAYRNGIREVLIPEENIRDLHEIPDEVRAKVNFLPVKDLMEVFEIAFGDRLARPRRRTPRPAPRARMG